MSFVFNPLRQLGRDLRTQKMRTFLTTLGIVWGTVAVSLLMAFGQAMHHQMLKNTAGLGNAIVIVFPSLTSMAFEGLGKGRRIRVNEEDIELVRQRALEVDAIPVLQPVRGTVRTSTEHVRGPAHEERPDDVQPLIGEEQRRVVRVQERARIGAVDQALAVVPASVEEEIAGAISDTERRAMAAERETNDRLIAAYLADRIGATFQARVSGLVRSGLFVRLLDTGADGFVPASGIGHEYFYHDEVRQALVGEDSGLAFQLGDPVEVRLAEAIPTAGALRFDMLSEGRRLATKPGRPRIKRPARGGRPARGKPRSGKKRGGKPRKRR